MNEELTVQDLQLASKWEAYLKEHALDQVKDAAFDYPETRSVVLAFNDVQLRDPDLADYLLRRPSQTIRVGATMMHQLDIPIEPKPRLHLRIAGLPKTEQLRPRDIKSAHFGRLVAVRGVVSIERDPYSQPIEIAYECKFCGNLIMVLQDDDKIQEPVQCDGCEKSGPWRVREESCRWMDRQKLTLQDAPETLAGNHQPRDRLVLASDDLVDAELAGQRVVVTAMPVMRWRYKGAARKLEADIVLEAVHVAPDNEQDDELEPTADQLAAYEAISQRKDVHAYLARSLAPTDIGNHWWLIALLLQLAGCPRWNKGNETVRGMIHVVIGSEPGMNKTMLLRAAQRCAPLCVRTDGHETSGGGVTASAVQDKEDGQWRIEAGAAARANGGILAIDELGHMHPDHHGRLFNLMEEGEIHVAKAGKMANLVAETSVLATMNPEKRHFDRSGRVRLVDQLGLDAGIRSRIDLLFCEIDEVDPARDRRVAFSVLGQLDDQDDDLLAPSDLRRYMHKAQQIQPTWEDSLNEDIAAAYVQAREPGEDGLPGTDPRLNATLRRLATAAARLRWSRRVDAEDLQLASDVLRAAMASQGAPQAHVRLGQPRDAPVIDQETRVRQIRDIVADIAGRDGHAVEDQVVEQAARLGINRSTTIKELERQCRHNGMFRKAGEGTYALL